MKRCSFRGSCSDNNGVFHGVVLLQSLDELGDGGSLLTDGHVHAVELLGLVVGVVPSLLVEDGIEGDGSFTGLTIANDQFTLATTDRHHGVDGLEASLYWLVDGFSGKDTRGLQLSSASLSGLDWTLAIDGVTKSVNDTAEHGLADRNVDLLMLVSRVGGGKGYLFSQSGQYA